MPLVAPHGLHVVDAGDFRRGMTAGHPLPHLGRPAHLLRGDPLVAAVCAAIFFSFMRGSWHGVRVVHPEPGGRLRRDAVAIFKQREAEDHQGSLRPREHHACRVQRQERRCVKRA